MFTTAKLLKKREPCCTQVTVIPTSFTDWEGQYQKRLPEHIIFVAIKE